MAMSRAARPAPKVIAFRDYYPADRLRRSLADARRQSWWMRIWGKRRAILIWTAVILLGVLGILGVNAALVITHREVTSTSYFALKDIRVEGASRLGREELVRMLGLQPGQNILALSIRGMEQTLGHHPWIRQWSIRRDISRGVLSIRLWEAEPSYWVREDDGRIFYADAYGRAIAPVEAAQYASLPLLEMEPGGRTLRTRLPELVAAFGNLNFPLNISTAKLIRLTEARTVEITTKEDCRLIAGIDNWEGNLLRLGRVMDELSRTGELKRMLEIRAYGKDVWVRLSDGPQRITGTRQQDGPAGT